MAINRRLIILCSLLLCLLFNITTLTASTAIDTLEDNNVLALMPDSFELANIDHPSIRKFTNNYKKHSSQLARMLRHASPYLSYVYQETQKRGLPAELALLPFVESEYNPFAYSHAGATGLWQIMPGTASGLGLKINWWTDERRSVIKATQVALDYLTHLYHNFEDNWLLAIAAYNSGAGTVKQALRNNAKRNQSLEFWALDLPRETRDYVPKLIAMAQVLQDPENYHITLPVLDKRPAFRNVTLPKQIELRHAAKLSGIPLTTLRQFNPQYRRWATPPHDKIQLLIPTQYVKKFLHKLQEIAQKNQTIWQRYTVKPGDNLSLIGQYYHTNAQAILKINHLKNSLLHPGQALIIPGKTTKHQPMYHTKIHNPLITEDHLPGPQAVYHQVTRYDSLEKIAKAHHVSIAQLRYWNQLHHKKIKPGDTLLLWKPPKYLDYIVRPGDVLSRIAEKKRTTTKILLKENRLKTSRIHPGQVLKIKIPPKH